MISFFSLLTGFALGFCISLPISPIGIICFRRAIHQGPLIGFFSGLGSASADFILSILAALGVSYIFSRMHIYAWQLHLVGSTVLLVLGIYIIATASKIPTLTASSTHTVRSYISIFFLTLSNPASIPSLAALFASLGLGTITAFSDILALAASIMLGAIAWWAILALLIAFVKPHLTLNTLQKINIVCGVCIIAFATITILKSIITLR